jgi:catechol 2,3-dioxygenase
MTDAERHRATDGGGRAGRAPSPLPDALRLGHVRLQVGDLARSLDYYTSVLGLEARNAGDGSAALHAADEPTPLVVLEERPGTMPVRVNSRLGLYHFAILVPDRAALGRFLAHLARTGTRVGASDHLVSEALYLRDPDQNGVEIYWDKPEALWPRTPDGQLAMHTRRLDLDSLLQEPA